MFSGRYHMQVGFLEHSKAQVPGFIQNLVGTVAVSKRRLTGQCRSKTVSFWWIGC
ncbi:hypothetical protein IC582_010798 [Cucumis melo]